ncbi:hypothetical protein SO802_023227 [Lithocarpus litseifolius]|uniref:Reverse transcriptase zinc-binding domain-containing protein n=1 Tax=Lithocarpus litseifolius TaxID=425828 RepID=A0AAW2C8U5_9ROSI
MCGGSGLGFDRDGGAEVENGREEEMRKKREKRGSLAGLVGRRDLGGGAADRPLKEAFSDLYNISRTRDASVAEVMCYANGSIFWDLHFRRLVNDQESQSLDSCMVLIYSTKVRGVGSDNLCWKPASSRGFTVSGFYHSLSPYTASYFPWKMLWQSKVPPRVAFFSWTAALGKILTIDNLRKRHFVVLEWCYMCKRCGESVDHLLLHSPFAMEMWSTVFCLFGICWVMP